MTLTQDEALIIERSLRHGEIDVLTSAVPDCCIRGIAVRQGNATYKIEDKNIDPEFTRRVVVRAIARGKVGNERG